MKAQATFGQTSLLPSGLEPSRPAADATREVVERWLLDGLM